MQQRFAVVTEKRTPLLVRKVVAENTEKIKIPRSK